ncbi:hypothetical protein GCM10010145_62070 [Streptomyces ruber]|uniref:DDE Tnp4 domain-containing protein n=2 Tax=Streptomyces TaxID=1883 RepID=A0A918EWY0_9ACTN|nr:hypothetical protein GCM10010145_62070 [Streptomyces ruber]
MLSPSGPGLRLRTPADVFAYARAEGGELRLDRHRGAGPSAGGRSRGGRAFVSGKKKQNTMKATVIADHKGRTLWTDALRPGRTHDATAARAAGVTGCSDHLEQVEVLLDDGYLGLGRAPRTRPFRRRGSPVPERCPAGSHRGNVTGTATRPTASPSNTAWPTTNAGNNASAGRTAATGCPTPAAPSPASSSTAPSPPEAGARGTWHVPPASRIGSSLRPAGGEEFCHRLGGLDGAGKPPGMVVGQTISFSSSSVAPALRA